MAHSPKYIDKRKKTLSKDVTPQRMSYKKKALYESYIFIYKSHDFRRFLQRLTVFTDTPVALLMSRRLTPLPNKRNTSLY